MKPLFIFAFIFLFSSLQAGEKYWIFFKEKNQTVSQDQIKNYFSDRALQKRVFSERGFDWYDLPVNENYVKAIEKTGVKIENTSRWLNAITLFASTDQLKEIAAFSFVDRIEPVVKLKAGKEVQEVVASAITKTGKTTGLDYGTSLSQNSQTKLVDLHNLGITGKGLYVGLLDAGTRWRNHIAFSTLKVVGEYDFVEKDSDASGDDSHGTAVLSLMAANLPGTAIGGTFGSSFLVAKTEYSPTETQIEEDNWVAGIEWMDAQGADVVNSSLGYNTFDNGLGYFYSNGDFDGKTAKATIAGDIAVKEKGIAVFVAAGNEGSSRTGTLLIPSDGFYIFSSGAVDENGMLASFSSTGPTNDGRTKPDASSRGVYNWIARPGDKTSPNGFFSYGNGTSYASPLSASAGALILSVYPELTPLELNDALRNTASKSASPDNKYGYGILDALSALYTIGPAVSNVFTITYDAPGFDLTGSLKWDEPIDQSQTSMQLFDKNSALVVPVTTQINGNEINFSFETNQTFSDTVWFEISGKTTGGKSFTWPKKPEFRRYFVAGKTETEVGNLRRSEGKVTDTTFNSEHPKTFSVDNPYPNPFNPETRFKVHSPAHAPFSVEVFNVLGQQVDAWSGQLAAGTNYLTWNPAGSSSVLTSGVYFLSVSSGSSKQVISAVYLR